MIKYSIQDNNIIGIRFFDGVLQTCHTVTYYEGDKAVNGGLNWEDVPVITSDNK